MSDWKSGREYLLSGLDWTSAREYLLSGSPLLLVGSSVVLLSHSFHLIGPRWTSWLICVVMIVGATQMAIRRYRR